MDLPPDKAKVLRSYDDDKKWEMIKDQEKVTAKQSPESYLRKLSTYLDYKGSRSSSKKRRIVGDSTSTEVLRDLEISLRTNSIEWVREFLSEKNKGLDVLIDYLTFRLATQQQQQRMLEQQKQAQSSSNFQNGTSSECNNWDEVNNKNSNTTSSQAANLFR